MDGVGPCGSQDSFAAREAAEAIEARERAPDAIQGWFGDVHTMKKKLLGAVIIQGP